MKMRYRCKWCGRRYTEKETAERHAVTCGIEYLIKPVEDRNEDQNFEK